MADVEIVNIAASGDLGREIDIQRLVEDIETPVANYDPDFNASFIRFEADASELVIVYTSGKYIVRGGDTHEKMENTHGQFLSSLDELGVEFDESKFEVNNVVCVGDLDVEVDLNQLAIVFGMESVEYEPEQFPGLVYRPDNTPSVLLVFSSGKVVVTGNPSLEVASDAFEELQERVLEFF